MIPKFSQLEHLQRNSREILLIQQQKEKEQKCVVCFLHALTKE